jgi:hypothetical protein
MSVAEMPVANKAPVKETPEAPVADKAPVTAVATPEVPVADRAPVKVKGKAKPKGKATTSTAKRAKTNGTPTQNWLDGVANAKVAKGAPLAEVKKWKAAKAKLHGLKNNPIVVK